MLLDSKQSNEKSTLFSTALSYGAKHNKVRALKCTFTEQYYIRTFEC